jgi:hypothetical protein
MHFLCCVAQPSVDVVLETIVSKVKHQTVEAMTPPRPVDDDQHVVYHREYTNRITLHTSYKSASPTSSTSSTSSSSSSSSTTSHPYRRSPVPTAASVNSSEFTDAPQTTQGAVQVQRSVNGHPDSKMYVVEIAHERAYPRWQGVRYRLIPRVVLAQMDTLTLMELRYVREKLIHHTHYLRMDPECRRAIAAYDGVTGRMWQTAQSPLTKDILDGDRAKEELQARTSEDTFEQQDALPWYPLPPGKNAEE